MFSAVPQSYKKGEAEEKKAMAPCGHTVDQAAWLGCSGDKCRHYDDLLRQEYMRWVAAGRPMPGGK